MGALSLASCKMLSLGQTSDEVTVTINDDKIYSVADEMPRFPGCEVKDISMGE